jgi:hypothetical protein
LNAILPWVLASFKNITCGNTRIKHF